MLLFSPVCSLEKPYHRQQQLQKQPMTSEVPNIKSPSSATAAAPPASYYRSKFLEFKKESQKLIQSKPALILVVDPGPPEEATTTTLGTGNDNNNNNNNLTADAATATSTDEFAMKVAQKQLVRCAEVDRCCEALIKVIEKTSPCVAVDTTNDGNNSVFWSDKVTSLPLILVNTSSAVSKFRRATRLYNGSTAFVVICEDFFNGLFYTSDLDRVHENIKATAFESITLSHEDRELTIPTKATSVLTVCQRQLEQKITQFLLNYQATPCALKKTLLGHSRPPNDRDDHVGTHSCAFVQESYQEQLKNEDTCTFIIYHASSCPACPCALRCTDFIVSFLQQEAARVCSEHQHDNDLRDDSDFKRIAKEANAGYPVKSGVVDFCPCGLKKTEKWPLLVCGAMNIEENEIDHSLFPELTIPHFRFFPCGKGKETRPAVIERTVRHPTFLFDRVREHYLQAAAQYSEGLATNETFAKLVTTIFERAKIGAEAKLREMCPQVVAALENKTKDDLASASVDAAAPSLVHQDSSNNIDDLPTSPTTMKEVESAVNLLNAENNNNTKSTSMNADAAAPSSTHNNSNSENNNNSTNTMSSSPSDGSSSLSKGTTMADRTASHPDKADIAEDMNQGKRAINPHETNPRTGNFDAGLRRSREGVQVSP